MIRFLQSIFILLFVLILGKTFFLDTRLFDTYDGDPGFTSITTGENDHWLIHHMPLGYFQRNIFAIKHGEHVRFINHANKPLALAFESALPGQSLEGPVAPLEKEQFFDADFPQNGLWHYFDKNNPSDFGVLYVAK